MTVGVFRDEHPNAVVRPRPPPGVKGAQLQGNESADVVTEIAKAVRFLVKAYPAGSPLIATAASLATDTILIDGPWPGSDLLFDWSLVGKVPEGMRMILARRADAGERRRRRAHGHPWGVDVSTGVEAAPGEGPPQGQAVHRGARAAAPVPYLADHELP